MTLAEQSEPRAIDQMLCFSLYAASRATTQLYRRLLKPWGLTYPQYLVMIELGERSPRTVGELCDDLALDSGTLSPLLTRLEGAGYVRRERSISDARVVTIHLTEYGRTLCDELASIPGEVGRCMGISRAKARSFISELNSYTAAVDAELARDAV